MRTIRAFKRILRASGTPHSIALGMAIGFVVAWTPTVGFQMMIAAPICLLFRANFLAAIPPIWLTNPATLIPIYSFNYWVGLKFVGGPGVRDFLACFGRIAHLLRHSEATWKETLVTLLDLTADFMWPLWIGCFVVGFALAIPSYFATYWFVSEFRARLQRRRARRAERLRSRRLQFPPPPGGVGAARAAPSDAPPGDPP